MTAIAAEILEQFRRLPAPEQRELCEAILREAATASSRPSSQCRKTIADIAGKYRPLPAEDAKNHDRSFAEAVAASKADPHEL